MTLKILLGLVQTSPCPSACRGYDNVGSTRDAVKTVDTSIADLRELSERIRTEIAEESVRLGLG